MPREARDHCRQGARHPEVSDALTVERSSTPLANARQRGGAKGRVGPAFDARLFCERRRRTPRDHSAGRVFCTRLGAYARIRGHDRIGATLTGRPGAK